MSVEDPDPALPARVVAYAGASHLVLAAAARQRLARLDYDFERLGALMAERDWTTVQLVVDVPAQLADGVRVSGSAVVIAP